MWRRQRLNTATLRSQSTNVLQKVSSAFHWEILDNCCWLDKRTLVKFAASVVGLSLWNLVYLQSILFVYPQHSLLVRRRHKPWVHRASSYCTSSWHWATRQLSRLLWQHPQSWSISSGEWSQDWGDQETLGRADSVFTWVTTPEISSAWTIIASWVQSVVSTSTTTHQLQSWSVSNIVKLCRQSV